MNYFTKELYEEMQIYGSLVFSDTKEEQEQEIEWYIKEGRDYYEESLKRFELISPYMIKYLPENLQKYIDDRSIMDCNVPDAAMREKVTSWRTQWNDKWKSVCDQYKQYYDSIYNDLPEDLKKMGRDIRIHDATIISLKSNENIIEMVLHTVENKVFQFIFTQVESFEYRESLIDNECLYEEIVLLDRDVFEIQLLLYNSVNIKQIYDTNEMKIRASGIEIIEVK